jgi:hypothetical protein
MQPLIGLVILGNQATLTLQDDRPILKFLGVGRSEHVKYLDSVLAHATNAVGGTYMGSPFWAALGQQEITVHAMYVLSEPIMRMLPIPDILLQRRSLYQ